MPPDTPLVVNAALGGMGLLLVFIAKVGWDTLGVVRDLRANVQHPRSGLEALWQVVDEMRKDITNLKVTVSVFVPPDA